MYRYLRSDRWLLVAALVAVLGVTAAACAGGASKNKPAASSGSEGASSLTQKSQAPADDARIQGDSASGASTDTTGGALALPSVLDRKMIITSTWDVTADDVSRAFEDVTNVAASAGGFVASSRFGHNGDRETASITIRVPSDRYLDAVNRIRRLGKVENEDSGSNEVTEEYTDLQSRMRNLQATEQQYMQFLGRAATLDEVLTVQDRLNATRAQIEQVQGRIQLLDHQTELATITVHLDPPPVVAKTQDPKPAGSGPLYEAKRSFDASLAVLRGLATVTLAVVAFSWWLVPVVAVVAFFAMRQRRAHALGAAPTLPPAA